jgi:molybdopterin adenylyltransferase
MIRIAIITVSDRASRGEYEDRSGPEMERLFRELVPDIAVVRAVVADEEAEITRALEAHSAADWIFTTGGTGPALRDVTPEAAAAFIDRPLPGLADLYRRESLLETPYAVFSRGVAGLRGTTFVVTVPGSVKAARLCARVFAPLLDHGVKMARGEGH